MLPVKLSAAVAAHGMFAPGDLVVVGVSGGADSVALLHGLSNLSQRLSVRLHVAHLDHMLRGSASAQDAAYVAELARSLGWPVTVEARDVAELRRRRKLTLEEAARIARYGFFGEVARSTGAAGVAVGHTADDQVETVVLHWLRGAGPGGLRGMRPVTMQRLIGEGQSECHLLRVLRPLLEVTRSEVERYCRDHDLRPRADATNRDFQFTRNRVRWELLPRLRRYNAQFDNAVRRTARIAAADDDFLTEQVALVWPALVSEKHDCLLFDLSRWAELPRSLQYRVLREGALRLRGDLRGLSAVHLDAAVDTMHAKPAGSTVVWPHGLYLVKRYREFSLYRGSRPPSALSPDGERLAIPGATDVGRGRWRVRAELIAGRHANAGEPWHANLDATAAGTAIVVRRRRPGDRFQPLGMAQEKKLHDFFVDAKVPRAERDEVPVVANDGRIIWLAGLRAAEWAKVTSATKTTLCLRIERLLE